MNHHINQVVKEGVVLMEVVIQCETDICYRAICGGALKTGVGNAFNGEMRQAQVRIILYIPYVIKNEGALQDVCIDQTNNNRHKEHQANLSGRRHKQF